VKLVLLSIGKTSQKHIQEGIKHYTARISRYMPIDIKELPDEKKVKGGIKGQKDKEASKILSALPKSSCLVALDEYGTEMGSVQFAKWMQKRMNSGVKNLVFSIGGPFGHGSELLEKADFKISLSKMTFPHDLIRLLFVEQLYRAMTILKNEPYHHK